MGESKLVAASESHPRAKFILASQPQAKTLCSICSYQSDIGLILQMIVNRFLQQGVGIGICSVHPTHRPGLCGTGAGKQRRMMRLIRVECFSFGFEKTRLHHTLRNHN